MQVTCGLYSLPRYINWRKIYISTYNIINFESFWSKYSPSAFNFKICSPSNFPKVLETSQGVCFGSQKLHVFLQFFFIYSLRTTWSEWQSLSYLEQVGLASSQCPSPGDGIGSGLPLAEHLKKTQLRIPHVPEDNIYIYIGRWYFFWPISVISSVIFSIIHKYFFWLWCNHYHPNIFPRNFLLANSQFRFQFPIQLLQQHDLLRCSYFGSIRNIRITGKVNRPIITL